MSAGPADLRPWFEAYLAAFNRADFPALCDYYAPDILFHGQAAQPVGREAVLAFYHKVRTCLHERIELIGFVGAPDGSRIAAELHTTLLALRDWPDMPTGSMRADDTRMRVSFAMYDIADSRFTRIRSARFLPPSGDAA